MNNAIPARRFSWFTIARALKRRKLYLLIPVVVLTPAVAFYSMRLPETYRSRALVGSAPIMQNHLIFGTATDVAMSAQDETRAVRETILSRPVLSQMISEFNLYPPGNADQERRALDEMKQKITVRIEGPESFYLGYEGRRPDETMRVTNRLAELFVARTAALRDHRADAQDALLDSEVTRLRSQLEQQEQNLRNYKVSGAQELPERLSDNLKQLASLQEQIQTKSDQIADGEAKRSAELAEMSGIEKQGALEPEPAAKTPTEVQIEELERTLAQLKARYTPEHPEIVRTEKELRDLRAAAPASAPPVHRAPSPSQMRYLALQSEVKALEARVAAYKTEKEQLIAQSQSYQHVVNSSPGYETALAERMRDLAVTRASYESALAKQQDARLNHRAEKSSTGVTYEVLEPAQLPTAPFSPRRARMILLALAASLGLGIAGVVVAERLDTSFETGEDFEAYTDIPLLVTVPAISAEEPKGSSSVESRRSRHEVEKKFSIDQLNRLRTNRIAVACNPDSIASQQYGILSSRIERWMEETGGKTLVVTSSTGEEGKSLTALNLSLALASSLGGGVLLVDCDLRLPQVGARLDLAAETGLADLLGATSSDSSSFITHFGDLDIMTAGTEAPHQAALLTSKRARQVFDALRERYRVIVLDTPPVVPVADSHTLASLADGVVMVVRARRTRPELFERAIASLQTPNLVGVVLNDVEFAATPYAYAYRYYQQHYLGHN